MTLGGRTEVLAQRAATGDVTSRLQLRGRFGIPLVAYDATAGGVSTDGRTLVLIRPRAGFPRRTTTFAVLSTHRWLRLRKTLRLAGDFSYDALSPDGRLLFSSTTSRPLTHRSTACACTTSHATGSSRRRSSIRARSPTR